MCENQNMEKKIDEVKVVHSQHARILKEDDEIWISSEDLNTENSSDDDRSKSKHAIKKKLKLKNRKRSSPNIKLQRPSIPSVASTSRDLDDRLLMPSTEDIHSRSTDESRTSDEEYHIPPIISECLSKRLSLEDWRPMRGALNVSSLEETASSTAGQTRRIVNEVGNFHNAMLYKLKSLKSCSILRTVRKEKPNVEEKVPVVVEKTFKNLKNTPEVRQKLDFINKLDDEISETISRYKAEREERLSVEFEMCKSITSQKMQQERGTEIFLQMCRFQDKLKNDLEYTENLELDDIEQDDPTESIEEPGQEENSNLVEENGAQTRSLHEENESFACRMNFIRKNIYAAKAGVMAGFSITDEEKAKIAEILKDIDDFQLNDADLEVFTPQKEESKLNNTMDNEVNAFSVMENDKIRMGQIDNELEKFEENQTLVNKNKNITVIKDEEFWKKYVLELSLKEIDLKLEKLYASYLEDDEKLKMNFTLNETDEEEQKSQIEEELGTITKEIEDSNN